MARARAHISERIKFLRRIWWGTVRVHPEYRRDVAAFLKNLRITAGHRHQPASIYGGSVRPEPEWRREIARKAHGDPPPLVPPDGVPPDPRRQSFWAIRAYRQLLKQTRLNRFLILASADGDLRALAIEFQSKWGLWFPVPAAFGGTIPRVLPFPDRRTALRAGANVIARAVPHSSPDPFITAPSVRVVKESVWTEDKLTLDVWAPAGKLVLDFIDGRLDHFQPHRSSPDNPIETLGPRVSRKRGSPGSSIRLTELDEDWLRLEIENPAQVDSAEIRRLIRPRIARAPAAFQQASIDHFGAAFATIRELNRATTARQRRVSHRTDDRGPLRRVDIVRGLALTGDFVEQVSNLKKRYRALCRRFGLPRF